MTQTEQLVELQNGVVTTTSLQVAETFGKNHRHILETIDDYLKAGVAEKSADLFRESSYVHPQNKQTYRQVVMNRDGFTLLAMGFTGKKALQFKLRYIQAFNEMEEALKNKSALRLPKNNAEMMQVIQATNDEQNQRIDQVETTVDELKDRFGLPASQAKSLEQARKRHIVALLGGIGSNAYQQVSRKAFKQVGSDFKDYFDVPRYDALALSKFDKGMEYIMSWQLPTNLVLQVRELNLQTELEV